MTKPHPDVDAYLKQAKQWRGEMEKLRSILLASGLDEEIKWRKPCYGVDGKNVAIMQPFKDFLSLMFFKGALLKDGRGLLKSQGENTQSALRLEFTSEAEIKKTVLQDYVKQAIAVEQSGQKVAFKAKHELELPDELTEALSHNRLLEKAWNALTPGRQRGYVLFINGAKQSKTRSDRIKKYVPAILAGRGMHDR